MNINTRQIPTRVQALLDVANRLGLSTIDTTTPDVTTVGQFEISSTNPAENRRIWINTSYDGDRPGSTDVLLYNPDRAVSNQHGTRYTRKLTQAAAIAAIQSMTPGVTVAQAETAMRQVGAELDGARIDVDTNDQHEQATALATKLDRKARVALRLVRTQGPAANRVPRATLTKVRRALITRGLATAEGILTDLGRAVRTAVL